MKKFEIDNETLERLSKIKKKKRHIRDDEECLFDTYSTQNDTRKTKAMNFKR